MATATYIPIATQTLSTAASSITFSSIPSTYTDLRLVCVFTGLTTSGIEMRFNGDTATNYSYTYLNGNGTAAASGSGASLAYYPISGTTSTTTPPIATFTDIFSYAGSTNKTILSTTASDKNGSGIVEVNVGLWRSTSAITSITVGVGENYNVGSIFTLWGI
jgi:hypothetical protein